jgi:cyclopropane fatty-acyl-phospholipid synthase-like methyltransferase
MNGLIKQTIDRYPLYWPRIYAYLRTKILPVVEIEESIPREGKILDVGCGYGVTTIYFALTCDKRRLIGSELVDKRIMIASNVSAGIPNVSFIVKNLIGTTEESFDSIVAIDLLHHITDADKAQFIDGCRKTLAHDGILVIKDIDKSPYLKYAWNYLHDKLMTNGDTLYFYSADQIKDLLLKNGFNILEEHRLKSLFYPHVLIVCKKSAD